MNVTCGCCISVHELLDLDLRVQCCLVELIKLGENVLCPNNLILGVVALELVQETNHIIVCLLKNAIFIQ